MDLFFMYSKKDVERKQKISLEQGEPEMDNNSVEGRKETGVQVVVSLAAPCRIRRQLLWNGSQEVCLILGLFFFCCCIDWSG